MCSDTIKINITIHINSNLDTFRTVQLLFLAKNNFLTKIFLVIKKKFELEILNTKLNLNKKYFQLKVFWTKTIFNQNIFYPKNKSI